MEVRSVRFQALIQARAQARRVQAHSSKLALAM